MALDRCSRSADGWCAVRSAGRRRIICLQSGGVTSQQQLPPIPMSRPASTPQPELSFPPLPCPNIDSRGGGALDALAVCLFGPTGELAHAAARCLAGA